MALAERRGHVRINDGRQQPFTIVAPVLASALVIGVAGGFALAATLTLSRGLGIPAGAWWLALAQAHGHLQLYGWAGLFVIGVLLHFVPRLRGSPLVGAQWVRPLLIALIAGLALRALAQPLAAESPLWLWHVLLVASAFVELLALDGLATLVFATLLRGPALAARPAFRAVLPLLAIGLFSLAAQPLVNLLNLLLAARSPAGLVPLGPDGLDVTLGLFGFLVPVALAMSAQSLPMYAGLSPFPRRALWPLATLYALGLLLLCMGTVWPAVFAARLAGIGMLAIGAVLLSFVGIFLRMMRLRGKLPQTVRSLAPQPEAVARGYRRQVAAQRSSFGPFVALVASAYMWALAGGVLLVLDGVFGLAGAALPIPVDAARHSLAVGFIALLICGIAPRMVPGFSGGHIRSPALVAATLWLGNLAALLRVGSVIAGAYVLAGPGAGITLAAFALSGPVGLALAAVLAVNLWPAVLAEQRAKSV
jgi:uncharacterized protein involved in response to NO